MAKHQSMPGSVDALIEEFDNMIQAIKEHGFIKLEWQEGSTRSLGQHGLWWMWMTEMASHFSRKGNKFNKDDMHELMKHQFLGYEDKVIGKTEIKQQLKSTTQLTKAEMHELMEKVDMWSADHGCLLPKPEDSVYSQLLEEIGA